MSRIIFAFIFTFSQLGLAKDSDTIPAPKTNRLELSVFAFSSARTVGEMLEIASILIPRENIVVLKSFLKRHRVELKTPMPAIVLKNDKLHIGQALSFDVKDSILWQNGANLKPRTGESFEEFLDRMEKTIQVNKRSKTASNWIQGILPYAYAESQKVDTAEEVAKGAGWGLAMGVGVASLAALAFFGSAPAAIIAGVGIGYWLVTSAVLGAVGGVGGGAYGYYSANQKRKVSCEPGELHLTTDGFVFKYSIDDDDKVKFPARVTNTDGKIIKTINDATPFALDAMNVLYYEACILKKSTALSDSLDKIQSKTLNTPGATGTVAQ